VWWRKKDRKLNSPKDKMADHLLGSNANRFRDVIGDIQIRGPNRSDHLGHCSGASISLDGVPEQGSDHTDDHSETGEVPPERRSQGDGEGNMELCSNTAIENKWYSADKTAENDAVH
jgi:hypothetical protein